MKLHASMMAVLAVVLVSAFSFSPNLAPSRVEADVRVDGQEIYLTRCTSCHQMNGEGVPGVFPPLKESEFVTGDKGKLIRVILNGLSGEIVVNGVTYNSMMPPWGSFLDDQQVADVLTYVRSSFGNKGDAVTPAEVAAVRASVKDRKDTWTVKELDAPGGHGIPGGD